MKKLLCLALLVSAGSIYSGSISANNKPTDNKSGNNSKDIYKKTWIHGLLPHGQKKSGRTVSVILMSRRTDWVNSVLKSPIRMPTA